MALPVFLGIPFLISAIVSIVTSLFGWFLKFTTKRIALVLLVITLIIGLTTAFYAAISALLGAIVVAMPDFVATAVGLVVPSNFAFCVSSIFTAHALRWIYEWNVKILQFKLL